MKNQILIILLGITLSSCGKQTAQIESKVSFLNGEFCETKEITTVVPGHYEFVPALTSYDYGASYYDYNSGMYMSPMPREVIITPAHEEYVPPRSYTTPHTDCYPAMQLWHIRHPENHDSVCFYQRKLAKDAHIDFKFTNLLDMISQSVPLSVKATDLSQYYRSFEELDRDYVENTQRKENQIIINAQNTYRNADKNSQFSSRMLTVSSLVLAGSLIGIFIFGNGKYPNDNMEIKAPFMIISAISTFPTLISLASLGIHSILKSSATYDIKTANLHLKNLETAKDENKNRFENEINHPKETQDKLNLDDSFMKILLQKAQSGTGKDCPDVQRAQELFREQNHS